MECPSCNRENVEDAKFCSGCGIKFEEILKCEGCEAELASDDSFCSACGKSVKDAAEPKPEAPAVATEQPTIESEKEPSDDKPIEVEPESEPEPAPKNLSLSEKIASDKREADERIERNRLSRQKTMPVNQENHPQVEVKRNESNGFRSIATLKRLSLTALWILIGIYLLDFVVSWADLSLWQKVQSGEYVSQGDWEAVDVLLPFTGGVGVLMLIIFVVVFLVWIHRASSNLKFFIDIPQRFSPGWAIGFWFIPILSFFRPYQVMKEIYEGSDPEFISSRSATSKNPKMIWWWCLWIIGSISSTASGRVYSLAGSPGEFIFANLLGMAGVLFLISSGILLIGLIATITNNQESKASAQVLNSR